MTRKHEDWRYEEEQTPPSIGKILFVVGAIGILFLLWILHWLME